MAILRDDAIYLGTARTPDDALSEPQYLNLPLANRHGLITGATGTGKTVSLQVLAEGFSRARVPVFAADIKGDLSGIAAEGRGEDFLLKRASDIGFADEYESEATPTIFWDVFGEQGHPVRTTVSEMGPLLLSRLMELNDTQEGVLNVAFEVADEEGLLLLDLEDLQALLAHVAENYKEISAEYGNVTKASVGAIQRRLLVLERQGAEQFFGEPALEVEELMRTTRDGRGYVNILAADTLMRSPRLYATILLWLLSELFEELPEVGDPDRPRLVFVFDEAHLLFDDAPKALVERIEQVVKLVRSKGVGVYFVTQNPLDVPDGVLAQLGNRIQHALRAYTPREKKAVKVAAETFRPNPAFDTEAVISNLGVGEALVSTLGSKGVPSMVERTLIRPPSAQLGPISKAERQRVIESSPLFGRFDETSDRESAHEVLRERAQAKAEAEARQQEEEERAERESREERDEHGREGRRTRTGFTLPDFGGTSRRRSSRRSSRRQSVAETVAKQVARTAASQITRAVLRGVLGSFKRGR